MIDAFVGSPIESVNSFVSNRESYLESQRIIIPLSMRPLFIPKRLAEKKRR